MSPPSGHEVTGHEHPTTLAWVLFLGAVGVGVAFGYRRGGRLSRIAIPWSFVVLIFLALAAQIVLGYISRIEDTVTLVILLLTYLLAVVCMAVMWRSVRQLHARGLARFAIATFLAGWALNGLVIVSNGGMPVSRSALETAGQSISTISEGVPRKHVESTSRTRLRVLSDVIPIPPLRAVFSVGDLVLLFGIGALVAASMLGTRPPTRQLVHQSAEL